MHFHGAIRSPLPAKALDPASFGVGRRVSDGVYVQLLREDGSLAGSMSGTLSEGRRNTVLLNLMLARGEGPIVIDQPEDELGSSFIYHTLVRDLRAAPVANCDVS